MIRKSIFYLFAATLSIALGDAQPPAVSLIPPDSEIRGVSRLFIPQSCPRVNR